MRVRLQFGIAPIAQIDLVEQLTAEDEPFTRVLGIRNGSTFAVFPSMDKDIEETEKTTRKSMLISMSFNPEIPSRASPIKELGDEREDLDGLRS